MKPMRLLSCMLLLALLASCSAVKNCRTPELQLPGQLAGRADSLTAADRAWWEFYADTALCRLIERTLTYNRDIRAAAARVEQARQLYRVRKAERLPEVSVEVLAENETNDYQGEASVRDPQFDLTATVRWEADLWGNLRWAKRRGAAEYMVTVEDERAMRMVLVAETATAYFRLVALDNELAIAQRTLQTRREDVAKAKLRFEGGLTSETVYQQAQVEYATTAAMIPDLERRIEITQSALSLLTGDYPGTRMPRGTIELVDMPLDDLPVGIPSELLQRRPDVRAAEARLRAALSGVGIAYADRFPRLVFRLTGGWENDAVQGLLKSPFSYAAGSLTAPIFGFGRKKAAYKAAIAAYEQSRLAYEQKVLDVFKEANDAIVTYRSVRETARLKADLRNAAREYVHLANLQYRGGSINYIDVLDAQRRYFDAQVGLSNAIRDEYLALVALYKALGGGWQVE